MKYAQNMASKKQIYWHVREIGLVNATDDEIIKYALQNKTIIVTKDVEFGNPLVHPDASCGIIILRVPNYFNSAQISNVIKDFVKIVNIDVLKGSVVIVELGRYRIRK